MDDLVKRLRLIGEKRLQCTACYKFIETADEAADRIEKLEAANLKQSCIIIDAQTRIEMLEAALARIAKYDTQAIAMDALRPGERIREKKDD